MHFFHIGSFIVLKFIKRKKLQIYSLFVFLSANFVYDTALIIKILLCHVQKNIFGKTLIRVCTPYLYASFGTFCV